MSLNKTQAVQALRAHAATMPADKWRKKVGRFLAGLAVATLTTLGVIRFGFDPIPWWAFALGYAVAGYLISPDVMKGIKEFVIGLIKDILGVLKSGGWMRLSPHFTLAELTASPTAKAKGIENIPTIEQVANLIRLAKELEKVRALTGQPLKRNSGFRGPAMNAAVGGHPQSAHQEGRAADFDPPKGWTHDRLQQAIAKDPSIQFDIVLATNLPRERYTPADIARSYRLRWQVELLFKEWKSYATLHAFDTANAGIVEGLIWAAIGAATLKR